MTKLIDKKDKIFIAGHNGMVGSSVYRLLKQKNYSNIITRGRNELDLCDKNAVDKFFKDEKPEVVILAAAKVGGIYANQNFPLEFLQDNLYIQLNTIKAAFNNDIKRLCFLGSSCIYPKFAKQPISEEQLLSSKLEESNEFYAIAKISGLKMCEAYSKQYGFDCFSVMPCNLYGPKDNYHSLNSHVIPSLIRKTIIAKKKLLNSIKCWGTGLPKREFMHVDDLSRAIIFLLENWRPLNNDLNHINVGSGNEISIKELIKIIIKEVNFEGEIFWDKRKPDGTPLKLLDNSKINNLGWEAKISLNEGIKKTISEILKDNLYAEWL